MGVIIQGNDVCTTITDEYLEEVISDEEYGKVIREEVKADLIKFSKGIAFLSNLSSVDRKYAKDLPRYENPHVYDVKKLVEKPDGKIRVDFANPHILEDMDYFRKPQQALANDGKYTSARPSGNPKSTFKQYWNEEVRRCWNGYVRESDGEWISGNNYYYWNYSTIKKAYVDPITGRTDRTYGYPNVYDGDYLFFHYIERARNQGRHSACLKARGLGYSFKGGSMLSRNFVLGENKIADKKTNSIALANEKEYLVKDGILNKFIDNISYNAEHTPFPSRRDGKDSMNAMHWIMGYIDPDTGLVKGTENQVMGVTLMNDPEKARGKRANLIIWEEAGKFSAFLKAWGIARPSVEHNGHAFGIMVAFGTGGTEGADFDGLKEIFYNPKGYNILGINNVFDLNARYESMCSFFHGRYLNYEGCMDNNGNSDVNKALVKIILERVEIKYNTEDANTLPQHVAENPITPQESILQATGSFFPVLEVKDYLEECRVNLSDFISSHEVGEIKLKDSDNEVEFVEDYSLKPIRSYTPDRSNLKGAIEIFVPPVKDAQGRVQRGRYIAGIDPVDADFVLNGSLASIFIFDTFTDQIVAEYTGRPRLAEEFYEISRRLLLLYNAVANYESNIKGLFGYFKNKNALHLLADTPSYLRDSHDLKVTLNSNASKGTRGTVGNNMEGLKLQLSWMLQNFNHNDGETEKKVLNLRRIPSLGYLEELLGHNFLGNFDRISAMGMLMIYRKELGNRVLQQEEDEFYFEEDEFIRINFDSKVNNGDSFNDLKLFENEIRI